MKEEIEELWKKYNDYKESIFLFRIDPLLISAYKDLQEKYTDKRAKAFINLLEDIVFKRLEIK